ncbi:MAG TPA: hypothetical protein VLA49_18565, partial [Anaerolineales bacterium]|nr:hypothetical protein [Anaerolineales bacterium]
QNMSLSERERKGLSDLKPIKYLAILPSQSINRIASDYLEELPKSIRFFMRITGATARGGGVNAASYLLFSRGFCRKLLELGYQDGLAQREAILDFFEGDE